LSTPSTHRRRFEIDVVRGFALFGVLLVNLYSFGADSIAWEAPADTASRLIKDVFFESRSWILFSFLFGLSFWWQTQTDPHRPVVARLLRRYAMLYVFGMANALLYDGDILMQYAQMGAVMLLLSPLPSRLLAAIAIVLLLVFPLGHLNGPGRDDYEPGSAEVAREFLEEERFESVYSVGSFREVIAFNAAEIPRNPVEDWQWPDSGLTVLALFLFGVVVGRSGVLADPNASKPTLRRWLLGALVVSLVASAAQWWLTLSHGYAVFAAGSSSEMLTLFGDIAYIASALAMAASYLLIIVLAVQRPSITRFCKPLAAAGRIGLTIYLTQTLIFSTIFYGYGFGAAWRIGPAAVSMLAVAIFAVQLLLAALWFRWFRIGLLEWVWRLVTDLEARPLRR
jgi:uncharacterized protein